MPFEKVETTVDFPAEARTILHSGMTSQAFEPLRAKHRGKPTVGVPRRPLTAIVDTRMVSVTSRLGTRAHHRPPSSQRLLQR